MIILVPIIFYATIFFLSAILLQALLSFTKQTFSRDPPGPIALPLVGHLHLISPLIHQSFHKLSSRYGPIVHLRLGSIPCVIASTPDLAKEFLKAHELTFSYREHTTAVKLVTYDSAFAFAPYGPYWKFIKKLSTYELLGTRNLNHFLPIRRNEVQCFMQLIMEKAKAKESVNVTQELIKLSNNIVSQMMLSIRCSGTESAADQAKTLTREVTQIFGEFNVSDFVPIFRNIDLQGVRRRAEEIHKRYDALLEKIITDRERKRSYAHTERTGDFLDILLDVLEDKKAEVKITRDHIKAFILDIFTAGTDTSATSIEWALAELMNNPEVLKKAQREIDEVVGKDRLVEESDGPNLPYIQAIIKEAFRLHPPIPMITRKSTKNCTISGYNIPAGTLLFVNIWSIGRNPENWKSPMEFRPERFLEPSKGTNGPLDVKGQHFQLLPFGSGRRGCPGMAMVMQELPAILAAMIQCFEWKMDGDAALDMSERAGLTVPRAHDLVCIAKPRISSLDIFH